eukprot:scaffold7876_cov145-Amphora_coffeaeformis.AAC.1
MHPAIHPPQKEHIKSKLARIQRAYYNTSISMTMDDDTISDEEMEMKPLCDTDSSTSSDEEYANLSQAGRDDDVFEHYQVTTQIAACKRYSLLDKVGIMLACVILFALIKKNHRPQEAQVQTKSNDHLEKWIKSDQAWIKELPSKTPLPIPLRPPFRIIEIGVPRSATTFQFHLLDAIVQLKSKGSPYEVNFLGYHARPIRHYHEYGQSWIVKSHTIKKDSLELIERQKEGDFVIFGSGFDPEMTPFYNASLYVQEVEEVTACSLCQVDWYRPYFDLNDDEVAIIKNYLHAYEQIRRCCGLQMSHYEVARLNGCNMTVLSQEHEYPHCEAIDKQAVEQELANSPITHRANDAKYNWAKPGDCARFDAIIASGESFNGHQFTGCPEE